MWNMLTVLILVIEVVLLAGFIIGRFQRRKLNETALFLGAAFLVNLALQVVPFLYDTVELGEENDILLGLVGCFGAAVKLFVGEAEVDALVAFADAVPLFSVTFAIGAVMAVLATVSTAIEVFSNTVRNSFRLSKALKAEVCDIVVGSSPQALQYARGCNAVLLLDDSSREAAVELMEEGFAVLRKGYSVALFRSRQLNTKTRYNVICPGDEKALDYIDTFIAYKKTETVNKNIYLYVEIEGDVAETVRREIIEKSGFEAWMTTFCTYELLARTFTEANPVTKYLPRDFVEDAAIKPEAEIHIFMLGFGKQARELYRQSILNNQLVSLCEDTYRVLPIHYHLCDCSVDEEEWTHSGIREALDGLDAADCFPLPELPFEAEVIGKAPDSREVANAIRRAVQRDNSYSFVIIDTEEDCHNIEIGARLRAMLFGAENVHIFIRSEASFTEDDAVVSYFGKSESVFTHDVVVNDSLSVVAKKLNEIYTAQYAGDERGRPDFAEYIRKKAEEDWNSLDYFTLYSNIYAAMNLRLKLNLLGLDYVKDGKGENTARIQQRHGHRGEYTYDEYFTPSVRNAMIAQEHARWNAYHLLADYLPLGRSGITVRSNDGKKVRFNVKNTAAKRHACLTTYKGLDALSAYLAEKAGGDCSAQDYDYYVYDEAAILSAKELFGSLGYSVVER